MRVMGEVKMVVEGGIKRGREWGREGERFGGRNGGLVGGNELIGGREGERCRRRKWNA